MPQSLCWVLSIAILIPSNAYDTCHYASLCKSNCCIANGRKQILTSIGTVSTLLSFCTKLGHLTCCQLKRRRAFDTWSMMWSDVCRKHLSVPTTFPHDIPNCSIGYGNEKIPNRKHNHEQKHPTHLLVITIIISRMAVPQSVRLIVM